jgi:riboflavin-specific deaminase-like protein
VRRLLPLPVADEVDLDEVYAYPDGRPWVRANMVASLDGSATADGRSGGLSSEGDRRVFRTLRGLCDVVLVGAATVRIEGYGPLRAYPAYASRRAAAGQTASPYLAVVTNRLDLDLDGPMFTSDERRTIVVTCETADRSRVAAARERADVVVAGTSTVDLGLAVRELHSRGLPRVLTEGGPTVLAQVAAAGVLDELCLTIAPALTGGTGPRIMHGPSLSASLDLASLLEEDGSLFARYAVSR